MDHRPVSRRLRQHPSWTMLIFKPVDRPRHIPCTSSRRVLGFANIATRWLEPRVPPAWQKPWDAKRASLHLREWCCEIGQYIDDASGETSWVIRQQLRNADPIMYADMEVWLNGEWGYINALVELLWRVEVGGHAVGAGVWLYKRACGIECDP